MADRIVFFDIDGTLLNTGGAGQKAMELTLTGEFRIPHCFDGVLTAGRTDRGILDELFGRFEIDNTDANRLRFRESYLSRLPEVLESFSGILLPGVTELLSALAECEGICLSLLTGNFAEAAWVKLRHFGLDHFFNFGGFGDDEPDRNNVARCAVAAAEMSLRRRVPGADVVVIGDTPADIRCARAVGGTAAAVATGTYSYQELLTCEPDHLFSDLSDTKHVMSRLLQDCRRDG